MSDQAHPGAVRLQSSAMVAAAIITTLGAITAACIQTGWVNKSPTINVGGMSPWSSPPITDKYSVAAEPQNRYIPPVENILRPTPRIAEASFTGTIEPYNEQPADSRQPPVPSSESTLIAPQPFIPSDASKTIASPPTAPSAAANTAAFLPACGTETKLTAGYAPALLAEEAPVKILASPWSFLTKPTASDKPVESSKTAKKPLDWGSVARFLPWHN